ncbi:MAG: rsbU 18 [Frankiales bacterium]|nr:rsbU 18 [Frankiales bacterium]
MTSALLDEVTALLERAGAHSLLSELCRCLEERLDARAQVWLVDYRQQTLRSTAWTLASNEGEHAQTVEGTLAGRCFAAQTALLNPKEGRVELMVPLTTRGRREGVLELSFSCAPDAALRLDLDRCAPLIAQALAALGTVSGPPERSRRQQPLTVAAEIQWSLLPGTAYSDADVTAAGLLEPAYSIAGDAFDWTRDRDVLHLAVLDGTGRGVPAALCTTLALGALRNARFAEVPLAEQAALADQAVYAHHGGEMFVSALMFQFDLLQGRARVVDAGSPQLYQVREGRTHLVELEHQLPLGMFEETIYNEQEIEVAPGDRFLIVSDGVHGTRTRSGASFSDSLAGVLRDCRLLSAAETTRHTLRQLHAEHHSGAPYDGLADDALVVCVDLHPQGSLS